MQRMELQLFAGEKTEPATPRKREESRRKGQVAKSGEVGTAALILAGFITLRFLGPFLFQRVGGLAAHCLGALGQFDGTTESVYALFLTIVLEGALILLPLLAAVFVTAAISQAVQVGLRVTLESVQPKFSRVNPFEGVKRIFSKRAVVEFAKSLTKIALVAYLAFWRVSGDLDWLPGLIQMDIQHAIALIGQSITSLAIIVGGALFIVAILDYLYQRYEFEQSIKMSKQEVKDEYKQSEGDPQIRSHIRQKQRQMAAQRMMQDVPQADVVITNPTHYAVAVQYVMGEMHAPKVVAKGVGTIALKIKETAAENHVATVENAPLAQALYKSVDIGQEIPPDLYPAVAEVLAFVYRLKNRRRAR